MASYWSIRKVSTSATTRANISKGMALLKKQDTYSSNLEGSALRTNLVAGCPITSGSPSPANEGEVAKRCSQPSRNHALAW